MLIGQVDLIENKTSQEALTYPCKITSPIIYMNSNTENRNGPNMHHINGEVHIM